MKRIVAVSLTLALFAWLLADGRWRAFIEVLQRISPGMLAIALVGLFTSYLLRALRVFDEFRRDGAARFIPCLRIVLIHNAMVNIIPFRGGEAAFPLLLRQAFGTPLTRALASLFWFRLQDAFVVMAIAAMVWPGLPLPVRFVAVAFLVLVAWALPRWANRTRPVATADRGPLLAKVEKVRLAFAESTRHARLGWLWTIANWMVKLAVQAWLLAKLLVAPLAVGSAGVLGAELASILPVQGVAGFGTYEAGASAAMLPHGIMLEQGLKAALVLHLVVIGSALSAGAFAWLLPSRAGSGSDHPPDQDSDDFRTR